MKIVTVLDARPQLIKSVPVSKRLKHSNHKEIIVHREQHYGLSMSNIFFGELDIPKPKFNLAVGSGPHGQQIGKMLIKLEKILMDIKPDLVMVYGDTNYTIAGALAASKLQIPLAHIEAGLPSFNRQMP